MNPPGLLWRFRKWRHNHGHHRFCQDVDILDRVDTGEEWIVLKNPDGTLDRLDVSNFGGRAIYRKGHG